MMKKRIKLFSSALAVGMLLGTGVSSLSAVTQQGPGTTTVAKADTETPDTQEGAKVTLDNDEMDVTADGIITGVDLTPERKADLVNGGILTIPAKYYTDPDNLETAIPIIGIDNWAFSKSTLGGNPEDEGIKEVIFEDPEGIVHIGNGAFYANGLTTVDLPNVETIGGWAFNGNELTDVNLPNVKTIGENAFKGNELTTVDLPNVETIGENAFSENKLTTVDLPKVETIGSSAFSDNKLTTIDLSNIVNVGDSVFSNNELTKVDLSDVNTIGSSAFSNNKLTEVDLSNVETIGRSAFSNNKLTTIDLSNITTVGDYVFYNNELTKVDLSDVNTIGSYAFSGNKLTEVDLSNVETIGEGAFNDNKLTTVDLPNVKTIGNYVFSNNELTEVDLSNVETIDDSAFSGNKLTDVDLPKIKTIGNRAFGNNSIKTVSINEKYTHDAEADPGTVGNPSISNDAFDDQQWNKSLKFSYQPTISYQKIATELGLAFKVNGNDYLSETRFKGSVELELNDNMESSDDDQKISVSSTDGGSANIWLALLDKSQEASPIYLSGSVHLTVDAEGSVDSGQQPGPEEETDKPDTGDGNESGNNNNGNENKPQPVPTPKPEEKRPHTVYAKRAMRLHRNVSLTSPIRSHKKQSRAKAASFRVRGIEYDKNGKKRYKVDGGYITAGATYVADSHFRSNKVRQVRVLSNRINSYKDVKLSSNKKVRSYKKGTKLKVKRIVNYGRATRFELTNGRYITGNKQLLIMDQK